MWLAAAPLFMLLLALVFLLSSGELTGLEANYPRLLAVIVAVMAVASIIGDYREGRQALAAETPPPHGNASHDDDLEDPDGLEGRRGVGLAVPRLLGFLALALVSVFLMNYLGFFAPAFLLVGGGLLVLGVRTPWKVVLYTLGVIGVAYVLFVEALQVPFPPAPWS